MLMVRSGRVSAGSSPFVFNLVSRFPFFRLMVSFFLLFLGSLVFAENPKTPVSNRTTCSS